MCSPRIKRKGAKSESNLFVCGKNLLCFMKHTIGLAADCVVRQNRIQGDDCPRSKFLRAEKRCYNCVKQHNQGCVVWERRGQRCRKVPTCYWYVQSNSVLIWLCSPSFGIFVSSMMLEGDMP